MTGFEITTDTVTNATKNSGLLATLATGFLYELDLN